MTTPIALTETGVETRERLRWDFAKLRAAIDDGAVTPEVGQQLIARYIERERITGDQVRAATPLTMGEKAANAFRGAYQGASFNFGDELMGTVRGLVDRDLTVAEGIADERRELDRFRTDNPKAAFATEMAGGLATGVGVAKVAGALPRLMLRAPLRTAAATGAIAGAGAGESPTGRMALATGGAVAAPLLTAGAARVLNSRAAQNVAGRVAGALEAATESGQPAVAEVAERTMPRLRTPATNAARSAVARTLADESGSMDAARRELTNLEAAGMGDEALLLNTGGEPAARTARAVANAPSVPLARTSANDVLGTALGKQGAALGRDVAADVGVATGLGGTPGPVALRDMQDELSARTSAAFEAFRARGNVAPEGLYLGLFPDEETAKGFARYVKAVRRNPDLASLPEGDARVIDEAFKLLQAERRMAAGGESAVRLNGLTALRNRVLDAIDAVDPNYAKVVRDYALDEDVGKVAQDAFRRGTELRNAPVGTFTAETRGAPEAVVGGMKRGAATAYQAAADDAASNVDLRDLAKFRDTARSVVGTQGQAERFKEIFGEQAYQTLIARLSPKIRAAALNGIVRGNSTTARQIMDAISLGDDAVVDALGSVATQGMAATALQHLRRPIAALKAAGLGETATEAAKLLSVRGPKRIRIALDALEKIAQAEARRKGIAAPVASAAVRAGTDRVR